jgi:DNA-directed RNA polymerase subunit RPC12/RpoP
MSEQCPSCRSRRIGKKNYGKKAAGVIGASAGTYGGYVAAIAGARTGAAVGALAGPAGGIGGAVIGALLGGATGASAGVVLGDVLDERVLDNHRCLECGYSFSANSDSRDDIL